jgi:hypothetical protein
VTSGSAFIEDNLTYDQLAAMSPMLVATSGDHGGGHGSLMDDGKFQFQINNGFVTVNMFYD